MLDTLNFPSKSGTGFLEIKKYVPNVPRNMQFYLKKITTCLKPATPAANGEYMLLLTSKPHVVGDLTAGFPWEDLLYYRHEILSAVPNNISANQTEYIERFIPAGVDNLYLYGYTGDENGQVFWAMLDFLLVHQPDIKRRFDHKEYNGG